VFPDKQNEILLKNRLDVGFRKALSDRAAMFVVHDAARLIENLPSTLPGHVAKIRVLEIERPKQFVKPPQLQEFPAIKSARSAAAVKAWIQFVDLRLNPMGDAQTALQPPAFRKSGFLAKSRWIGKEDLAGDCKDALVSESVEQRLQEARVDPHVAV